MGSTETPIFVPPSHNTSPSKTPPPQETISDDNVGDTDDLIVAYLRRLKWDDDNGQQLFNPKNRNDLNDVITKIILSISAGSNHWFKLASDDFNSTVNHIILTTGSSPVKTWLRRNQELFELSSHTASGAPTTEFGACEAITSAMLKPDNSQPLTGSTKPIRRERAFLIPRSEGSEQRHQQIANANQIQSGSG